MSMKSLLDNKGRTSEEREAAKVAMEEINQIAKDNWHDPEWRREMAAVLTESILEGFELQSFFDQIVDVERVGFDDRVYLEEMTGLKVFFIAKGGNIEASSIVSETITLPRDTLGFHVYEFEDKLLSGFGETMSRLRSLAASPLGRCRRMPRPFPSPGAGQQFRHRAAFRPTSPPPWRGRCFPAWPPAQTKRRGRTASRSSAAL